MSWRTSPLPPDWEKRRQARFEIDGHRCTTILSDGTRCKGDGTLECDHIGEPDDHRIEMLRTKCGWCHRRKTAQQANQARSRVDTKRPDERHPGLR